MTAMVVVVSMGWLGWKVRLSPGGQSVAGRTKEQEKPSEKPA